MAQPSWIGHTLGNRYKLEKLLGQGGMSAVYKATDPNLRRSVAIKLIHGHLAEDPEFVRRFEEEAAAVAQLRHPNIVQVYDFSHDGDTYYMVLEFVPGETLHDRLRQLNQAGQRMPLAEVASITTILAKAVDYAHQRRMIHRDLKPANVMLMPSGEAILMDFGIVKIVGGETHTATGAMVGTVAYMAPEQIRGQRSDHRTDIYALGVMLFEMVSGQRPFQGDSAPATMMMHLTEPVPDVRQLNESTPPALVAIIEKAMTKEPDRRFQTAAEMAAALAALGPDARASRARTEATTFAPAPTPPPPPVIKGNQPTITPPPPRRPAAKQGNDLRPWLIGSGVIGVLGLLMLLCGGLFINRQINTRTLAMGTATAEAQLLAALAPVETELSESAATMTYEWLAGDCNNDGISNETYISQGADPCAAPAAGPTATATATATAMPSPTPTITPAPTATSQPTPVAAPPTATPSPVPTHAATATAVPAAPTATAAPSVRISRIELSGDRYAVYYDTPGFTPSIPGQLHIHFFFNNVRPENAGVPGSGPWKLYDLPVPFTGYGPGDRPEGATQLCALVANHDHSVQLGTGNCVNLP